MRAYESHARVYMVRYLHAYRYRYVCTSKKDHHKHVSSEGMCTCMSIPAPAHTYTERYIHMHTGAYMHKVYVYIKKTISPRGFKKAYGPARYFFMTCMSHAPYASFVPNSMSPSVSCTRPKFATAPCPKRQPASPQAVFGSYTRANNIM